MAEWLKAADCKSADVSLRRFESFFAHRFCECSSAGRASAFQAEGRAFESRHSLKNFIACVAQQVEHFVGNEEVTGSIPVVGSKKIEDLYFDKNKGE